jgi:hypothetical protein
MATTKQAVAAVVGEVAPAWAQAASVAVGVVVATMVDQGAWDSPTDPHFRYGLARYGLARRRSSAHAAGSGGHGWHRTAPCMVHDPHAK